MDVSTNQRYIKVITDEGKSTRIGPDAGTDLSKLDLAKEPSDFGEKVKDKHNKPKKEN